MRKLSQVLDRLRPLKRRERPFENRLRTRLEKNGLVMFVKCKPTVSGWPDRIAVGYRNKVLVEVKREDTDLDEHQAILHGKIKRLSGQSVVVVHGPDVEAAAITVISALRSRG